MDKNKTELIRLGTGNAMAVENIREHAQSIVIKKPGKHFCLSVG